MAPESLAVEVRNNTSSPQLFVSVTGTSPSSGLFLLSSDGTTAYHPASPSQTLTPPSVDVGTPIGGPGSSRTLTVPRLNGARIWFSKGQGLKFFINPGPALVEPSVMNASDENYEGDWGFAEFTLNAEQLYVNISYVDFVSLPVSLGVLTAGQDAASMRIVPGLPGDGLQRVAQGLEQQGGGWEKLVVRKNGGKGDVLRVLSPNSGNVVSPGLWDGYYDGYVDKVWTKYAKEDLVVNTQYTWGDVTGRVTSSNNLLTFKGKDSTYSFARPSAQDIFSCSTGPFAHLPETSQEQLNVGARLAAAFNRSTLLVDARQPEGEKIAEYYVSDAVTNHYARVCHEVSVGGRGYAFPYDDVGPSGRGEDEDQSGFLNDGNPARLVISVGKPL